MILNGYATLAEVKARLDITTTAQDTAIETQIEAASRWVDEYCGRSFWASSAGVVRYYTADDPTWLQIDDVTTVTAIAADEDGDRTYERTWTVADYDLDPPDASQRGNPYNRVVVTPNGDYTFPVGMRRGVKITGTWGWPAVPKSVTEAVILLAVRLRKRNDAPFGIAGSAELGMLQNIPRTDPDVAALVAPYRRLTIEVF